MSNRAKRRRVFVELTATWGNDDAESTLKVSRRRWASICAGVAYEATSWSWYEGVRSAVVWTFANSTVTIEGEDGMQAVADLPVLELIARESGSS